jgi:hypothetical protein
MLPNSSAFLCGQPGQTLRPLSKLVKVDLVPFCFERQTDHCFLYSDTPDGLTTAIFSLSFTAEGETSSKQLEEFMGIYEYCCFGDEHALLMNK